MKAQRYINLALAILAAAALVVGALSLGEARGDVQQMGTATIFTSLTTTDDVTVGDALAVTGASTLTGALAANGGIAVDTSAFTVADTSGNTSIAGTLAVTDDATLSESLILAGTNITPTTGSTLTVDKSFYIVNSTGAITMTLGTTGAVAGQTLILYGDDNNTVTINDTNVRTSTGSAINLGQYDVMYWIYSGSEWIELLLLADS